MRHAFGLKFAKLSFWNSKVRIIYTTYVTTTQPRTTTYNHSSARIKLIKKLSAVIDFTVGTERQNRGTRCPQRSLNCSSMTYHPDWTQ